MIRGPYAYVRNPMAMAGLAQGAAVGLGFGSWSVLGYVIVGGLIWDRLVRPAEEANLKATFGLAYKQYRNKVKCWRPRLKPYKAKVS